MLEDEPIVITRPKPPYEKLIDFLRIARWKIVTAGCIVTLVSVLLLNYFAIISLPFLPKKIAADVNGQKIYVADYNKRLAAQTYFYTNISPLSKEELIKLNTGVLEEMIQEKLLTKLLSDYEIIINEEEVRQKIKETAVDKRFEGDWTKYENELKKRYHTTLAEVERTFRLEILKENLSQLQTKKHILSIWVSKDEPQFVSNEAMTSEDKARLDRINKVKKDKAEALLLQLQNGADFTALANKSSEDPASAKDGGNLGFLFLPKSPGSQSQEKLNSFPGKSAVFLALEELDAGNIKLYELFTGYAIIKVAEVKDAPLGTKSFEQWYPAFRANAKVNILK